MTDDPFTPYLGRIDDYVREMLARTRAKLAASVDVDGRLQQAKDEAAKRFRADVHGSPPGSAGSSLPRRRVKTSSADAQDLGVAQTRLTAVLTVSRTAPSDSAGDRPRPVNLERIAAALDQLEIRYLTDENGSLLALWQRHAMLFALEGPSAEILVIRARPHATVPPDWVDRSYRAVNEWNHTRRFYKAYIGDPTNRGQLPIYGEMQVPLMSGAHDALLVELIDCAAVVAMGFVDWLHDEGALL